MPEPAAPSAADPAAEADAAAEVCPASRVIERIAHKWTLSIHFHLDQAGVPVRFRQLQRRIGPITQKELTKRLRQLERSGLVARTIYAEVPPRVEYRLTDLGRSLRPAIAALHAWAEDNAALVAAHEARFDREHAAG